MNDYEEVESDHWIDDKFTNVRTGEKFSISDFEGKQVLVETFAVLCPACKRQQL